MPRAKSGKRRNKVQFKLTKEFIFLIVGLVILIGATIYFLIPTRADKLYKEYQGTDTSTTYLSHKNCYTKISYDKLMKKVNKNEDETFFVYYSTSSDSNCLTNIVTLNSLASTYDIDKIYLLDATDAYNLDKDDDNYYKDLAELERKQDELNLLKAGHDVDDIDLQVYSQLFVFQKSSTTGNTELVFNTQTILDDKFVSGANFSFAVQKCFSLYSSVEIEA